MSQTSDHPPVSPKRPYAKPAVRQVNLRSEEAVLGNCKTASVGGPGQALCTAPSNCSAIGS